MTPDDIELVQSTFEKVRPISEAAARMFYGRLFEIAPEVKPLFKGDMAEQGRKLIATLAVVVGSLHSLQTILPAVSTLAKKHVEYGVKPSHYAAVGAALLWTLERGLGAAWTPDAAGGKLNDQEKFKREQHPFDAYSRLKEQAANNEFPKPADTFRWKYYGLFYVSPAQDSYMCRLRMPNGILKHWQLSGLADLALRYGGGYSHVTTRANLQIRDIEAKNAVALLEEIQDLGLCSRGSGADNIRNVTGTPTAGIDPQELLDTRPYAREWHFHILNERGLYGLPRKFNVAFDGAGTIPVLEDTNDIGFQAVEVKDGFGIEPGVWFKLALGGITGHKDFARDTGVIVKPADATKVADAVVRVFIDHGDRTDRTKARLKYVIDAWGFEKFLGAMEEKLGHKLVRAQAEAIAPRPPFDRTAHIGAHRQKQTGLCWIGVV